MVLCILSLTTSPILDFFCGAFRGVSVSITTYPYRPAACSSSWRCRVNRRAMSRRTSRMRAVLVSRRVAYWKRRLNSSCRSSSSWRSTSASPSARSSCFFIGNGLLPDDELGVHGQLVRGEPQRLLSEVFSHAGDLEHDAPR